MCFRSKWVPLIFMAIVVLTSCSSASTGSPLVNNTPPSQQPGNHPKLFVFLSGFTSQLTATEAADNNGYGNDPDFFSTGRIQPFLQTKFPGSYFLTYSYSGFNTEGKPSPYACAFTTDNYIADLAVGLYSQISQFLRSHSNTPNIDVYVIGHSLGGVIAFSFLAQMVGGNHNMLDSFPDGGALKGVFTLDSPIGGVTNNWFYTLFGARYAVMQAHCNGANLLTLPIVGQLNDLFNSTNSPESQGATASVSAAIVGLSHENNQAVALTAMQDGLTVSTFANDTDVLWQPSLCNVHLTDFLSTQWLQEVQGGRNKQGGAVYARTFSAGTLDCNALSNQADAGNHFAVLTNPDVQTAIWQVIVGQDPNALMSVPTIQTPPTPPVPAPTPIPSPITPTPSGSTLSNGTWQGQGTYNNGQSSFDMLLTISVNGNTFTGTLTEDTYSSEVAISGSIISSSGNSVEITFTDPSSISGSQIELNCTYTVTISNGQMRGVWYYPGDSSPDGNLSLHQIA